ncbi:MAG TPA: pyridoxamine 5'-phosphate oxidase family protein [Gemmatimonadaceae bacterium]|nr:pyridoxamine 5'-phosphate oxidase family protein [Gemmatimonadaceae bacterium]
MGPSRQPSAGDEAAGSAEPPPAAVTIREMSAAECEALLARHRVGRLAYAFQNHLDIEPLHYVYHDGWVYGRTSHGLKLHTLLHSRWVAFEVDEVRDTYDWESVVVRGAFYVLASDGSDAERAAWRRAVKLLRTIAPETLTPSDPMPHRTVLFRIHVDEMSGRAAARTTPA